MLDISRNKVPKMKTLYRLLDRLAEWKINQFQLYMEHTFAYSDHREVWADASPMTAEEIRDLDAYCRERFIETGAQSKLIRSYEALADSFPLSASGGSAGRL